MSVLRRLGLACLALAPAAAQAQFSTPPLPQPRSAALASEARSEKAYRKDAGRHFYSAYPAQVMYGVLPPLLYAVMVTDTDVDANGKVLRVHVRRPPAGAKEVTPWVVGMIRHASPLPPPVHLGKLTFTEVWLVHKSGRFQVDSLTEGQR